MFGMRTRNVALMTLCAVAMTVTMVGCGGGGGGVGSDPQDFSGTLMLQFPSIIATNGTTTVDTVNLDYSVPSASGPNAGIGITAPPANGDVHRVEIQFSRGIDIASIFPNFQLVGPTNSEFVKSGNNQNDAIRLVQVQGGGLPDVVFNLLIDRNGSIDNTNALDGNETPATLRLYVEDPMNAGQVGALPAGQYRLSFRGPTEGNPIGLRTIDGEPFCLIVRLGECVNPVDVTYSFDVGGDTQAVEPAPSPSVPVAGSANVNTDQEFVLRFNEAVDFQSLAGQGNITSQEPFVSTVLPIQDLNGVAPGTAGANVVLTYGSGSAQRLLPPNYGFVMYMPDPFHDPTQVRIRIVDSNTASGTDNPLATPQNPAPVAFPVTTQNYGLDPDVYESIFQPAPTNNLGNFLSLPPIFPLPASTPTETATLQILVLGTMNANAADTSPIANPDGAAGVTDRARNPLANDLTLNYALRVGPQPSNNPVGADLTVAVNGNTLSAISAGRNDTSGVGVGTLIGQPNPVPNPLNDSQTVSSPIDVVIGAPVNPANGAFVPRGGPGVDGATVLTGGDPAIPNPQNGATADSWDPVNFAYVGAPYNPTHGDFLYVIDGSQGSLRILNSNTFQQIGTVLGVSSPGGLGIDPGRQFLYVSNRDQGTVQRVDVQPASPAFHTVISIAQVGTLPSEVVVQPDNEDVLVLNDGDDSFSRVTVQGFVERSNFNSGPGAIDIWATPRWLGMGTTGAYQAFVSNSFSNQVTLYESDSIVPQVFNSNGPEGKIWQTIPGALNPTNGTWNLGTGLGGGFIVANNGGTSASEFIMSNFNLGPQPGFMGPPPFRTFSTGTVFNIPQQFGQPTDVCFPALNAGTVVYVSTSSGNVLVYNGNNSIFLGSVITPATELYSTFDQ